MENRAPYTLVFHNEFFIAVDKAPLVLSVPARGGESDSRPILGRILERDFKMPLYPVHRLDFDVQGLILFAKTPAAHRVANVWFEQKEVVKTYAAWTRPLPDAKSSSFFKEGEAQVWKSKILRGKKRAYESPHGKDSLTHATLIGVHQDVFKWELQPITGRSHQLRFELFRHGHAIVGDELYGSTETFSSGGIALRAFRIDFGRARDHQTFLLPERLEVAGLETKIL